MFRKVRCLICEVDYETIDVPRSRYFIIQFLFLFLGFIFLIAAFILTDWTQRTGEFLGISIMGISMWLFTLYFQLLDSKEMEFRAKEMGMQKELEEAEGPPGRLKTPALDRDRKAVGLARGDSDLTRDRTAPQEKEGWAARRKRMAMKEEPPPPKVVRIRRALPRTPQQREDVPGDRSQPREEPPPLVIRDMSSLLNGADDDEEEDEPDRSSGMKMKKAKKIRKSM
jgi:hypothetical protein